MELIRDRITSVSYDNQSFVKLLIFSPPPCNYYFFHLRNYLEINLTMVFKARIFA